MHQTHPANGSVPVTSTTSSVAGQPAEIEHADGRNEKGKFPSGVSPHQPFFEIRAIRHQPAPGIKVEARMEGEIFEMEDQRNWIDSSFKTYCTPLSKPFPFEYEAADRIEQRIILKVSGTPRETIPGDGNVVRLSGTSESTPLPPIGLQASGSDVSALTEDEAKHLKDLFLAHLRVELDLEAPPDVARRGFREAQLLEVPVEIALHFNNKSLPALKTSLAQLQGDFPEAGVVRWLVFHRDHKATYEPWLAKVRDVIDGSEWDAPVIGGTDAFFTELNRNRPPLPEPVAFSTNPQVHAFDDLSLVETLGELQTIVASASEINGGNDVHVSPLSLRMRWNPNATSAPLEKGPGELPDSADPRQRTVFGALWSFAAILSLARVQVASLTLYEIKGCRGLFESKEGSLAPDAFPSVPGERFPVLDVLQEVLTEGQQSVEPMTSTDSLRVIGFVLAGAKSRCLWVANLSRKVQCIALAGSFSDATGEVRSEWKWRPSPIELSHGQATLPARSLARFEGGGHSA